MGIGRHDRIAVVLPNGPELAVAILTVAASAACAPLNPAYGAEELDRYFADLHPRALITQAGFDSPARRVALVARRPCHRAVDRAPTWRPVFSRSPETKRVPPSDEPVSPGDVAMLLPTSGTTARPKIVPLTHANMCTSAYAHAAALALKETDRCLNVMPLFHGHGLHGTLVASLAAGASVVCTPGFDAERFFGWLTAFQPTWYSAVPTMHQAILAQARHNRERAGGQPATLCPLLVGSAAAEHLRRTGASFRGSADRVVWDDGSRPPRRSRAIRCRRASARRVRSGCQWFGCRDHGRRRELCCPAARPARSSSAARASCRATTATRTATEAAFAGDWFKTGDLGFLR